MSPEMLETKRTRYVDRKANIKSILYRRAKVIELFIGCGLTPMEVAELMGMSYCTVLADLDHYFKKPLINITLKSKI